MTIQDTFTGAFHEAIADESESSGFRVQDWYYTRRGSAEADYEWWLENGPGMCQAYIDWFEGPYGAEVWRAPDGRPAIELELTVNFGDIPVKMVIDQVLKIGSALVVVDVKTAAAKQRSFRQLGLYASGIERQYGIRPRYGAYFMARKAAEEDNPAEYYLNVVKLDGYQYSYGYLASQFAILDAADQHEIFPANPSACFQCPASRACPEITGKERP